MEEKLNEFRRRRQRERIWNILTLKGVMEKIKIEPKADSPVTVPLLAPSPEPKFSAPEIPLKAACSPSPDNVSIVSDASTEWSFSSPTISRLTVITYCLYALLWVTMLLIAIELRFGAVYFVISGLVFIYLNTRTGPRKQGEISAYSVFNPNCEAIDGALKPEQFEREFNLIHYSPT